LQIDVKNKRKLALLKRIDISKTCHILVSGGDRNVGKDYGGG
jgi:hypothetical protein